MVERINITNLVQLTNFNTSRFAPLEQLAKSKYKVVLFCKNVKTAMYNLVGIKSINRFGGHINQLNVTTVVLHIR
jgi:hypothetical protein